MEGPRAIAKEAAVVTAAVLVFAALLAAAPVSAFALAPHVPTDVDTDTCGMCHRGHTSASSTEWSDAQQLDVRGNALIFGNFSSASEEELCYVCHGVDGLGAQADVQADFQLSSKHILAPDASEYGPEAKGCNSCHDSHGSDRDADGEPFPSLLRSDSPTSPLGFSNAGDDYCVTCHANRPSDTWDGIAVWKKTAHASAIAVDPEGTRIVCSACHASHGASSAPLIASEIAPPSVSETIPVPANDRRLCFTCHPNESGTFGGVAAYNSSTHGSTPATVSVPGEWPLRLPGGSQEATRQAGECQVCHNPMGTDDGSGEPVAKLLTKSGKSLCYTCHETGSAITNDMSSLDPTPTAGLPEIVLGIGSAAATPEFGRLQMYSNLTDQETGIGNPREFAQTDIGPVAVGDYDGDSRQELLVSRAPNSEITAMTSSGLGGMEADPGDLSTIAPAAFLLIANVIDDASNLPEVVTADGTTVRFYRWNTLTLSPVASVSMTGTITGLAAGDVTGTANAEVAVTTNAPDRLEIISATGGSTEVIGSFATRQLPAGPSVGDMTGDGRGEIAVANTGELSDIASVFGADGNEQAIATKAAGAESPVSVTIADLLTAITPSGTSGAELVVLTDDADIDDPASTAYVYNQTAGGGLTGTPQSASIGSGGNPTQAVIADLDRDNNPELAIALAGSWSGAATPASPGVFIADVQANNANLGGTSRHAAGGTESGSDAADRAWIAVRDLGVVGPTRHQAGAVAGAHVATESADFRRHVECADCHNTHEATSTADAAPAALGAVKGTWGVAIQNAPVGFITYSLKRGVDYEYELCLKCHGTFSATGRTRDIASEADTRNASFHGIEGAPTGSEATAGSFESTTPAWTNTSRVRCTSCHGNSDESTAKGPHISANAPILRKPYLGIGPSEQEMLCYECHKYDVYYTGSLDGLAASTSRFYSPTLPAERRTLHAWHTGDRGIGCRTCHTTHGSVRQHMIRGGIGYSHTATGGSCTNGCHGGAAKSYAR